MVEKLPTHLPISWFITLIVICSSIVGATIAIAYQGGKLESAIEGRLHATEVSIDDINKELNFRISIRNQMNEKLDRLQESINGVASRLSHIEGRLGIPK